MEIKLTNTMSREKEVFQPIKPNKVNIYTCGLTVYNYAHIGNLRAYVFSDILRRMFEYNGFKVNHVMNITDVGHLTDDQDSGEDKLEKGARREHKTVWEIAQYYTDEFIKDLNQLNIIIPEVMPKATDHISEMIELIKLIEKRGFTYSAGGNLYFDTTQLKDYGKLARLKLDAEKTRTRVEEDTYKKNPFDFVLWFTRYKYSSHSMLWDSPWGKGFPGWHVECSAMSSKYLGNHFDIHTGGIDHIPVHHTNEIAQSEVAFGHKWVNYWLHNDFLVIEDNQKMAKSKQNFLRLQTLIDRGFHPLDYRYFLLGAHYRKNLLFSFDNLQAAKNAVEKLRDWVMRLKKVEDEPDQTAYREYQQQFNREINDDLNTPRALSVLWEVLNHDQLSSGTKLSLLENFDQVLGLNLSTGKSEELPEQLKLLVGNRDEARNQKNFKLADQLRDEITRLGYQVIDSPEGTIVKKMK
ncbi:MAG: cysteine--tRNA ligase [bacterium]